MRSLDRRRMLGMVAIILGLSAGCGGGGPVSNELSVDDSTILQVFGEDYRMYSITKKRPPRKIDEMKGLPSMALPTLDAIEKGDIVVQWGATLPDLKEEPGQSTAPEILAYAKAVPEQGGYVLHLDRTVSKMTADEFKAAPKAAGKAEDASSKTGKK